MTLLVGLDVLGLGVRDVAVRDGLIVEPDGTEAPVDCRGLVALPALVDPHTHLRDPGPGTAETIETGSLAAARGGYGAVCAMPNTVPVADTPEICDYERRRGAEVGLVDVVPVGAVTRGELGDHLADIAGMGVVGVRMFSDDGKCVARSDVMRDALTAIAKLGGVLAQHAQDPLLTVGAQVDAGIAEALGMPGWPSMAETVIVARDAVMGAELGCRVHACHVSTAATVMIVRWAKSQGLPLTAEVTPHHLLLDSSRAHTGNPAYKVNPPLRSASDVEALRDALADGTIDVVGTDHAPHAPETKQADWCEASMGMLGLETALAVVAELFVTTGRLTWADVADRMSIAPARIVGILGHGQPLEVGAPANICLVDPQRTWRTLGRDLASIAENTPYEGMEFSTRVVATLLRGKVTYDLDARFA